MINIAKLSARDRSALFSNTAAKTGMTVAIWEARRNTKQDQFNKAANIRAENFLRDEFIPVVQKDFSQRLGFDTHLS
jgi:hypothetical protein